jgi:hypothetical protein
MKMLTGSSPGKIVSIGPEIQMILAEVSDLLAQTISTEKSVVNALPKSVQTPRRSFFQSVSEPHIVWSESTCPSPV